MDRRHFIGQASLLALGSGAWARRVLAADPSYVVADTAYGKVRGVDVDGIKTFKGIPYGASTAGRNRFMPPQPAAKWTGIRDALKYGPSAPQRNPETPAPAARLATATDGLPAEGEDCLVLNVWTPAVNDGRKRPVMFWCHGGGFATGSGSSPGTDGTNLARRGDVVVVSINHRLNVLGFTNLVEQFGRDYAQSGDAGMLDIVLALQWVRTNIDRFGGDPNTVMIFGQSGGGRKVSTLLTMPSAKGLFHRATIESGATIQLVERDASARVAERLMAKLGLNNSQLRELQSVPLPRIMSAYFAVVRDMAGMDQMTVGFSPTMDGKAVSQHPYFPNASPVSADVPVMIGHTRTELTLQSDEASFSLDEAAMRKRIGELLGDRASRVIDVYRTANPGATPSDL